MTPELLRDVAALCERVAQGFWEMSGNWKTCIDCRRSYQGFKPGEETHSEDCPVLLARRIREEMKADG